MKPSIVFKKIWEDDDMIEITISVCDGRSQFACDAYWGRLDLSDRIKQLTTFKNQIYGGLYDLRIGEFGPEYASGAFHARLEFHRSGNGKLAITAKSESDWEEFTHTKVASSATMFLRTEPALLDNWIVSLKSMAKGNTDKAVLECIE